MSHISTIYTQVLQFISRHHFEKCVKKYKGNHYVKKFNCWQQFTALLYAQIRGKDSLRDIVTSFNSHSKKLYHIGAEEIRRSTFADANNHRDYRIYEELFYYLLERCKNITPKHKFKFKNPLYSLDASVIDLCLKMFPWAKFRKRKGAIKLHCLYDHSGSIPNFLVVTDGKQHEIKVTKKLELPIIPDSIISIDRAYIDFKWLYSLEQKKTYFVTRAKKNMKYEVTGQHMPNMRKGILYEKTIKLTGYDSKKDYPKQLRLIGYVDPTTREELVFLTNNFKLASYTITQIYKSRWQIEIFFKWIKQHLKIKSFLGTSKNAVMTQIWIAMCCYLLLSYIKYQTKYSYPLLELARIIAETIFERIILIDLLSCNRNNIKRIRSPDTQYLLF